MINTDLEHDLLNATDDMLALVDTQLCFLAVNQAYSGVFQCTPASMIGKTIMEMFSHDPEHLETVVRPNFEEALTGVDSSYGVWADIPEIGRKYFEILARPIFNDQQVVERLVIIGRDGTEKQLQLEALEKSREMLKRTEKIANLGGWIFDIKTGVMSWTDEMYAIHEVGRNFDVDPVRIMEQFYSKDQHARMNAWMEKARQESGSHEVVGLLETANGNRKWVRSIAFTQLENGELVSIEGVLQDITETYVLDQELKQSEEKFRNLVEETNAVVWEVALDPIRYTYLSPQAETLTGYSMDDWKKDTFMETIMHPDDKPAVMEKIYNNLTVGNNFSVEYRIIKADGSPMWIHDNVRPIKNERNQVVGARGVFIDISSMQQMKAGLDAAFRSITTYEEALNQHAIVSVADRNGRYTYVNDKFLEITGYDRDELIGTMMTKILPEDHPDTLGDEIVSKLSKQHTWQGELEHLNKNGESFWVYATIVPLFDSKGKLESSITIRTDITELKRTELALRKTQKLEVIGQLTGGVAHDFNNLLSIIIGNLELMQLDALLLSRAGDLIGNIKSAASRGSVLTRRLLNYSRKTPVNSTVLNLNDCLSRDLNLVSKSLTNMVSVETDFAKDLWLVDVDEGDLEDSIINLAINAGDAMLSGGTLKFQSRNIDVETTQVRDSERLLKGQYVELVISDNGVGIDPEFIDKIFDPYFTTKPADKGSGLGLAMVYGFVKRSQGEIFVTSTPGEGSRFEIYFPRANTVDKLGNVEKVERKTLTAQSNETILVVDDEDIIAETTASHLERLGYNVLIALNGDEAIDVIRSSQKVDLIFSDIVMPGRYNGYQLAEEVLKIRPEMKLLFATGYSGVEARLAHNEWVDNTIQKPYSRVEMSRKIREVLVS